SLGHWCITASPTLNSDPWISLRGRNWRRPPDQFGRWIWPGPCAWFQQWIWRRPPDGRRTRRRNARRRTRGSPLISTRASNSKSKSAVQFEIREVRVRTVGENASKNSFAGCVGNIERECRLRIELVICAQIEDVGESFLAA